MIQIFTVTAPLGAVDPDTTTATLQAATARVAEKYPGLLDASAQASDGVLTLTLKVSAANRWYTSSVARKIATSMLKRVRIRAVDASMVLTRTLPSALSLTKAQGRSVAHPVESTPACEDLL